MPSHQLSAAKDAVSDLLGGVPVYVVEAADPFTLLSESEHRFISMQMGRSQAFTTNILDILLSTTALSFEWQGRGFCTVLCEHAEILSEHSLLGLLIHEAAHYADDCDDAARDAPRNRVDIGKQWLSSLQSNREAHGLTFLAAATHLYWRARNEHCPQLRIRDVLPQLYGHSQRDVNVAWADAPRMQHLAIDDVVRAYRRDLAQQSRPRRSRRVLDASFDAEDDDEPQPTSSTRTNANGVATIPVVGLLDSSAYDEIEEQFNEAIVSSDVGAIVLYCNSPGGEAIGCKRVADRIYKRRRSIPVIAYVQGACSSAAYYMAAACDSIEATADSLIGGVGTQYEHGDLSRAYTKAGVRVTVITNADSPKKSHGNPYQPLTPESRATLQNFVEAYGRAFINDVATYRGVTPGVVRSKYGRGDTIRASRAVKRGMIDGLVGGLEETIDSVAPQADAAAVADRAERKILAATRARAVSRLNMAGPLFLERSAFDKLVSGRMRRA